MKTPDIHYAQSWALIHYLRCTTRENEKLFEKVFEALQHHHDGRAALREAFTGVSPLQLDSELEGATIVFIVCDRGDRYLSSGVFGAG